MNQGGPGQPGPLYGETPMGGLRKMPFYTFRLLEITVPAEYNALTDSQKEKFKMIISCGIIDTNPGSIILEAIYDLFPEGTATRASLDALLTYTPPGP